MGRAVIPVHRMSPAQVLLGSCPFLEQHRDEYWDCGDTIIFGDVARLLQRRDLTEEQTLAVFATFNELAESGDEQALDVLVTGAIETFNDDASAQRLARAHLKGRGLDLLEECRRGWGQPDYCEIT